MTSSPVLPSHPSHIFSHMIWCFKDVDVSGIRLGMTARESHIKGVIIEKAGLFDYTTRTFKPGKVAT